MEWQEERKRGRTLRYNVRYMFLPRNVAAKPRQYRPYEGRESETVKERGRKRKKREIGRKKQELQGMCLHGEKERERETGRKHREAGRYRQRDGSSESWALIRKGWL